MKHRLAVALAAIVSLAAGAAPARAQQLTYGLTTGMTAPRGVFKLQVNSGYSLNGVVGVSAPMLPVSFRGELGYNGWSGKGVFRGSSVSVVSATANAIYRVPGLIVVRPYAITGFGWHGLSSSGVVTRDHENDIGWNLGAGANFGVRGLKAMAEVRYYTVKTTAPQRLNYVPVTVGIMF